MGRRRRRRAHAPQPGTNGQAARVQESTAVESVDLTGQLVDPADAYRDEHGVRWLAIGGVPREEEYQKNGFRDEAELAQARQLCRYLARRSAYCINGHQNRISYTVGTGHTYTVVARKGREASRQLIDAVQRLLDDWCYDHDWAERQAESLLREDRDGEAFLRLFRVGDEPVTRFVEPAQVFAPEQRASDAAASFGVQTDEEDAETVLGYWVDGEYVESHLIQHRKANVDRNVRRGCPLFFSAVETLSDIRNVRKNMALGSKIQTSLAYVKRVEGGTKAAAESQRSLLADQTVTNRHTGRTEFYREHRGGRVVTVSSNVSYEAPFAGVDYSTYVEVIADHLREIASLLVMPEFMLTSDASNANFASTMVAEGPAVKMFERLQDRQARRDLKVMWAVVECAVQCGRLPEEAMYLLDIQAGKPTVQSRNSLAEAQVLEILTRIGLMSKKTAAGKVELDYEQERQNMESEPALPEGTAQPTASPALLGALAGELDEAQSLTEARQIMESYLAQPTR